jgi:hypothetical protein
MTKIFPIMSVNNFFPDPDKIVKYSKNLKYEQDPDGRYPGVRTKSLNYIDPPFFNKMAHAIFTSFYNYKKEAVAWKNLYICFHKNTPYSKSFDDVRNKGWIHKDDALLAGMVYLTKGAFPESGTALYKPAVKNVKGKEHVKIKKKFYRHNIINIKEYTQTMKNNHSRFIKTHEIKNTYNTMIMYNGSEYHAMQNMYAHPKKDRLTLLFFLEGFKADSYPIERLDNILKQI